MDRLLLLVPGLKSGLENTALSAVLHWRITCSWVPAHAGEPTVSLSSLTETLMLKRVRWLIDNDKDAEGMRVIADLHGGDPEDLVARAEFDEIKERVIFEVSRPST